MTLAEMLYAATPEEYAPGIGWSCAGDDRRQAIRAAAQVIASPPWEYAGQPGRVLTTSEIYREWAAGVTPAASIHDAPGLKAEEDGLRPGVWNVKTRAKRDVPHPSGGVSTGDDKNLTEAEMRLAVVTLLGGSDPAEYVRVTRIGDYYRVSW